MLAHDRLLFAFELVAGLGVAAESGGTQFQAYSPGESRIRMRVLGPPFVRRHQPNDQLRECSMYKWTNDACSEGRLETKTLLIEWRLVGKDF